MRSKKAAILPGKDQVDGNDEKDESSSYSHGCGFQVKDAEKALSHKKEEQKYSQTKDHLPGDNFSVSFFIYIF